MRAAVKGAVDRLGFVARRHGIIRHHRRKVGRYWYETVFPTADYAPWLGCHHFIDAYAKVIDNTLVDKYRCFELWDLAGQIRHLHGNVIEVGVWRGGSGCLIAARIPPGKKIYLCDTFSGVVKASEKDSHYRGGEHADTSESVVTDLVKLMGLHNVVIKAGVFPDDFRNEMDAERFCFAHVDVDVYRSAKEAMSFLWPRMPVGGITVVDDYGFDCCDGIRQLIDECRGGSDKVVLHNLNGHAVVIKTA
ncbi:MAG TPA: TylF/MycF/NovP-related O-methyltransferase [Stellaceae bacterium]|nr:TylF/MycF/NovP-related O-methyltransferase [Stellaceae bacterium]